MFSSIAAAVTPKADFSLADVQDVVDALREENAALKAQVAILSNVSVDGSAPPAAAPTIATAASLAASASTDATARCLATELRHLEAAVDAARLQGHVEREELALRCEELGRALEQRVLQAERAQHEAVEQARHASRQQVEALEEQLAWLAEEQAQREALDGGTYGAAAKLGAAEEREATLRYRCDKYEAERAALERERDAERARHADELRQAERAAVEHAAESEERLHKVETAQRVQAQLESQLVRLSEGFNKQVEEVLSVQRTLERTRETTVDKATARSWVVNYVEASQQRGRGGGGHAGELLGLMADWWAFTSEDLQRVGLGGAPHPSVEAAALTPSESSLSQAFAFFLDDESEEELLTGRQLQPQQHQQRRRPQQQQPAAHAEAAHAAPPPPGKAVLQRQPPPPRSPVRVTAAPSFIISTPMVVPTVEPPAARSLLLGAATPATADARSVATPGTSERLER